MLLLSLFAASLQPCG